MNVQGGEYIDSHKRTKEQITMSYMSRFLNTIKQIPGLGVIIAAAVLLELVSGIMFYTSHNIIQETMERCRKGNGRHLSQYTQPFGKDRDYGR